MAEKVLGSTGLARLVELIKSHVFGSDNIADGAITAGKIASDAVDGETVILPGGKLSAGYTSPVHDLKLSASGTVDTNDDSTYKIAVPYMAGTDGESVLLIGSSTTADRITESLVAEAVTLPVSGSLSSGIAVFCGDDYAVKYAIRAQTSLSLVSIDANTGIVSLDASQSLTNKNTTVSSNLVSNNHAFFSESGAGISCCGKGEQVVKWTSACVVSTENAADDCRQVAMLPSGRVVSNNDGTLSFFSEDLSEVERTVNIATYSTDSIVSFFSGLDGKITCCNVEYRTVRDETRSNITYYTYVERISFLTVDDQDEATIPTFDFEPLYWQQDTYAYPYQNTLPMPDGLAIMLPKNSVALLLDTKRAAFERLVPRAGCGVSVFATYLPSKKKIVVGSSYDSASIARDYIDFYSLD